MFCFSTALFSQNGQKLLILLCFHNRYRNPQFFADKIFFESDSRHSSSCVSC